MYKTLITDSIETDYLINEDCEIIHKTTNRKINVYPIDKHHRYARVRLFICGKWYQRYAHRVLMETFCPVENSKELQINHIDGNRANNSLSNLEWVTSSENIKHAFRTGLMVPKKGENNPRNVLKEEQVVQICEMLCKKVPQQRIAEIFGVSDSLIHNIRRGIAWVHISSRYKFPTKMGNTRITEEDAIQICEMIKNGVPKEEIASLFGVKVSYIKDFKQKRTWRYITEKYDF